MKFRENLREMVISGERHFLFKYEEQRDKVIEHTEMYHSFLHRLLFSHLAGVAAVYLDIHCNMQRIISNENPELSSLLQSRSHRWNVASMCFFFYKYFYGYSSE